MRLPFLQPTPLLIRLLNLLLRLLFRPSVIPAIHLPDYLLFLPFRLSRLLALHPPFRLLHLPILLLAGFLFIPFVRENLREPDTKNSQKRQKFGTLTCDDGKDEMV